MIDLLIHIIISYLKFIYNFFKNKENKKIKILKILKYYWLGKIFYIKYD